MRSPRLQAGCLLVLAIGCTSPTDYVEQPETASISYGVDYSLARPSPQSIRSAGNTFVVRYSSPEPAKNLTAAEAASLIAAGLDIVSNFEDGATNALGGYSQGVTDATLAQQQLLSDGAPATRPIYFSVDFDAQSGDMPSINAYFDGVASVIGQARTGAYGGINAISQLFDAAKIDWGWQTYAWSGGAWDSRAQMRQTLNGIDGGQEDQDEALVLDFGQWGSAHGFPENGSVVSLAASNGQYVSSQGGTSGTAMNAYANRTVVGAWEQFVVIPTASGYALASQGASGGNYYCSAENGGGGAVQCNSATIGPSETFTLEWQTPWQVAFRTQNGHYLNAQNGGGGGVDATATAIGSAQTFAIAEGLSSTTCTSAESAAASLNGVHYWTCEGSSRYLCDDQNHKIVEACGLGCTPAGAGVDDQCNASSVPQCTSAEYTSQNLNNASYWTCQGNSRYVCDGNNNKVTELCPAGCLSEGTGADDECDSGPTLPPAVSDHPSDPHLLVGQ